MTKTIFGKKLLLIATITVLVTGLTLAATLNDAEAVKPIPNLKEKPFKCSSSGTFDGEALTFSQTGKCSHMGETTISGTFIVTGLVEVEVEGIDCVDIVSIDTELIAANGDIVEMSITGIQCFFDEDGEAVSAPVLFCSGAQTSTVDGTYVIDGGDGRFIGATGSGDIFSNANHCDDTFDSTISGTIVYAASNKS